ncbi:PPOX class F420-dependent oxidoreductase [Amycolatopsis cynarae]|uniref:PPOX class F420-dependent oxidoreductase n=1 Tax=Amycolatopsis cynarae TaxID=2995223 RepID=A0ABY7B4R7_9PSEU|nr:PPOX class F420-dependent oxidoreductase [Amycolatopsis sp. HUAS 11-8]WAL67315.1 PPOX class F420-dependent oxidoreductase [Amycolatopsis sp. HUAS 11-8]
MASEIDRLGAEKFVLLTTYRRDGRPVPTPVWAARDGDELLVWSERRAGKVKRIRAGGKVTVQACDVRGKQTRGAVVTGQARILDAEGSARVRRAIARKYGLIGQATLFASRLRGGTERTVGLAITLDQP